MQTGRHARQARYRQQRSGLRKEANDAGLTRSNKAFAPHPVRPIRQIVALSSRRSVARPPSPVCAITSWKAKCLVAHSGVRRKAFATAARRPVVTHRRPFTHRAWLYPARSFVGDHIKTTFSPRNLLCSPSTPLYRILRGFNFRWRTGGQVFRK